MSIKIQREVDELKSKASELERKLAELEKLVQQLTTKSTLKLSK